MASSLGSLGDYLTSLGTAAPDVAGAAAGGGLGSLGALAGLAGGPIGMAIGAIPAILSLAGINPLQSLMSSLQGLPANAKPQMFANYMQSLGGLPSDLGALINAAQNQAGSGTGILSMSGPGAYNPNFDATLLEALTGQNLGAVGPTGRQTFTAPATGQVQNPVSLSFLPEQQLMASAPMQGLSAYGYTPQQLSTPAALKAIEKATNYGMVGTGAGEGTAKVAQYLPKVVQALQAAGIYPGGGGGSSTAAPVGNANDYTNQTPQSDTSNNNNPNYVILPLSSLSNLFNTGSTTTGTTGTGSGSNLLNLPSNVLSKLLNPSQTLNLNMPAPQPWVKAAGGFSGLGFAPATRQPNLMSPINLSTVGG